MGRLRGVHIVVLVFLAGLAGLNLHGQTRSQLEQQRKKLQRDIQINNRLLKENQRNQESSVAQLHQIERTIEAREALIENLMAELNLLATHIDSGITAILELEVGLERLIAGYKVLVRKSYLYQRSYNSMMIFISSRGAGEAVRRSRYFSRMSSQRRQKAIAIRSARDRLQERITNLEADREAKREALEELEVQKEQLASERQKKEVMLGRLRSRENELVAAIRKKSAESEQLSKKINEIIKREIEEARRKAEAEAKRKAEEEARRTGTAVKPPAAIKEAPESAALSNEFVGNRGKLPWPVERGVITGKFGRQAHAVFSHVEIQRDGVDIDTDKGAGVRTVFKGEVSTVIRMPGFENVVIIRHGRYLTVYGNLASVSVKKGDKVTTRQRIGQAYTQDEGGRTMVHFRVMNGELPENPELWLAR
jgi:murein hydrolase activator